MSEPVKAENLTPEEAECLQEGDQVLYDGTPVIVEKTETGLDPLDADEVIIWAAPENGSTLGIPIRKESAAQK